MSSNLVVNGAVTNVTITNGVIDAEIGTPTKKFILLGTRSNIGVTSDGKFALDPNGTFSHYATLMDRTTDVPLTSDGKIINLSRLYKYLTPFSNVKYKDPAPYYLLRYQYDGNDGLTLSGTANYRLSPEIPDAKGFYLDASTTLTENNPVNTAKMAIGSGAFTISFWHKRNLDAFSSLFEYGDYVTDGMQIVTRAVSGYIMRLANSTILFQDDIVNSGQWHLATFTSTGSGGTGKWYINGVEELSDDMPVYNITEQSSIIFGDGVTGTIDGFRFYDRVLTENEIEGLYNYRNDFQILSLNPLMYIDTDDKTLITESAGSVSQIDDKTENGNNLTQATALQQPITATRRINGILTMDCDGNMFMGKDSFAIPSSGNIAFFLVAEIDVIDNSADSIISCNTSGTDFQFEANNATQFDGYIRNLNNGNVEFQNSPYTGPAIFCVVYDYTGSGTVRGYVNGVPTTDIGIYNTKLSTPQDLRIFSNRGDSSFPDGAFADFVVTEDCSEECRQYIEAELAWKYGLVSSLPAEHPYKTIPPKAF